MPLVDLKVGGGGMKRAVGFLMVIVFLTGCASMFAPSFDAIKIHTEPPGAKVYDGVNLIGTTPLTHNFERDVFDRTKLSIRMEGYKTHEFEIGRTLEKTALFNFGFFLTSMGATSWGIDVLTGNMIKYAPDSYLIDLDPAGPDADSGYFERRSRLRFVLINYDSLRSDIGRHSGHYLLAYHRLRNLPGEYDTFLRSIHSESRALLFQKDALALFRYMEVNLR